MEEGQQPGSPEQEEQSAVVTEEDEERRKLQSLLESVDEITEVWEGFSLMQKYEVAREHCSSLQDIRDRLRLHFRRQLGQGRGAAEAAEDVIGHVQEEDAQRRAQLATLYQDTQQLVKDMDEQVLRHLQGEGTCPEHLLQHLQGLQSNKCPILVTGETSSGKSSLLNLLLGQEVLPHSLLSCTSCTCRLGYGPSLAARVHSQDGEVTDVALSEDSNLVEQLEKYIFKAKDRQDTFQYKEVEIFLPMDMLKNGVYIIDSPGFGENPSVDKMLLDYITDSDIFAFIYVIKSDNAGGVQEDRLQRILRNIVEHHSGQSVNRFDPRAAIFVCNRWDLVPDDEKDLIKKDTFSKLCHCWPELKDSQIFHMSTTKAWNHRNAGYISEDYSKFLDGIQRLIPVGLQGKITHSYKWLEHFLKRALHHVTSYLASTRMSHKELKARHSMAQLRLHRVEKEADVVMKKLNKKVDKSVRQISKKLCEFLSSAEAKKRLSIWSLDELPMVQEDDVWGEVEPEVDKAIEKRLTEMLQDWDEENRLFRKVQLELLTAFKDEFLVLENQLTTIEQCLHQKEGSLALADPSEDGAKYTGLTQNVNPSQDGKLDFNLDFLQKLALGIATPVLLPVAIGLILGAPIFLLWDLKKWRRKSLSLKNMASYIEDPVRFVTSRAHLFLSKVSESDNVSEYVYAQLEPARAYLESMRTAVPKLVESNRQLMESILQDRRTSSDIEEKYSHFQVLIPELQERLAAFGNLHVRKYDYKAAQLEMVSEENNGGFQLKRKLNGLWTEICPARLSREGKKTPVSAKMYLPQSQVSAMHLASEELHFRKVYHPCISQILGTFEAERGIPGMLLEEGLVPARREVFGFRLMAKASKGRNALMDRCTRILEQIGVGLEYLHYRGIVHLELTLDTVMIVAKKDIVKLVNLGEPRTVSLPADPAQVSAGPWVYLPPEVLQGQLYTPQGDMYGLGVLAWELGNQELAFKPQRTQTLQQVISTMGHCELSPHGDISAYSGLVQSCTSARPEERMCSTMWVNEIKKIIGDQQADGQDEER